MDISFTLTTNCRRVYPLLLFNPLQTKRSRFSFTTSSRPSSSLVVFASASASASKDESNNNNKLDSWDQMELKFGRMLGEDPKLTLAKIAGRKANPDVSYLEIEKNFNKKKFLDDEVVEEFQGRPISKSFNLVRPVPKKGTEFKEDDKVEEFQGRSPSNTLNLVRPVPKKGTKFEEDDKANKPFESQKSNARLSSVGDVVDGRAKRSSIPNVILRKPSAAFPEDDVEDKKSPRLKIKPNLSLRMSKGETKENFTDITLLKRPDLTRQVIDSDPDNTISGDSSSRLSSKASKDSNEPLETRNDSIPHVSMRGDELTVGLQPLEQSDLELNENEASITQSEAPLQGKPPRLDQPLKDASKPVKEEGASITQPEVQLQGKPPRLDQSSKDASKPVKEEGALITQPEVELQGKPPRLDQSLKDASKPVKEEVASITQPEVELQGKPPRLDQFSKDASKPVKEKAACLSSGHAEITNFISAAPLQEFEDADWSRAEYLCNTGGREDVELISCSIRGFVASFGSLIGFLPYRNLGAKWKFLAFESWLKKKGLDPSMCRQNLGIVGRYESLGKNLPTDPKLALEKVEGNLSPNMKLEDLLEIYDQEKIKFLSSFIGLRIKVNVVLADRPSRKLMFSGKPKERDELIQKKRSLMAKLNVGDVVKCCIKKITYFGIFVEVEGAPALIHQSEMSWDVTLDPSSFFKIGQIVEAKVHQLDFAFDRITLSLKEIMPNPLIEALESVVGDHNYLEGSLEAAQADIEWTDVKSLIKELEDIEGVQSVSKGRFFLSPGLAPTFQVYMASMFQNQYKLLARSGNKVQEVIVQTLLDKEEMKAAILACTNRVE